MIEHAQTIEITKMDTDSYLRLIPQPLQNSLTLVNKYNLRAHSG